jgi:hypothetical protein
VQYVSLRFAPVSVRHRRNTVGMALQRSVSQLEGTGQQEVVIVQRTKVRSLDMLQSLVKRCGEPGFASRDQAHSVVAGQFGGKARVIGRAIQDDERARPHILLV